MTTAPAADQLRLLDVQALDTRTAQLAHRRRTLPVLVDLDAARAARAELGREQILARTAAADLRREVAKAEADVDQVRARAARDRARLDSGTGTSRDLTALTSELESLARRQGALEEVELEVMERLEVAEAQVAALAERAAELDARVAAFDGDARAALAEIDSEASQVAADRELAVVGLAPALLALYERTRAHGGGLGAAPLRGNRCDGCRLELNPIDLEQIRSAPADEVVRCEECGRILVRGAAG